MARNRTRPAEPANPKRHPGFRAWVTGTDGQRRYARDYGLKAWPIFPGGSRRKRE